MFCPRCSQQQQLSDTVRFCSRCGFPLNGVAELLASGGQLVTRSPQSEERVLTKRQRGMRKGVMVMAAALALKFVVFLLGLIDDDLFVLLVPVALIFVIGFLRWLYGWLLEGDTPASQKMKGQPAAQAQFQHFNAQGGALPPAYNPPLSTFPSTQAQTSEMSAPPSIAEGTTRMLDEKVDRR